MAIHLLHHRLVTGKTVHGAVLHVCICNLLTSSLNQVDSWMQRRCGRFRLEFWNVFGSILVNVILKYKTIGFFEVYDFIHFVTHWTKRVPYLIGYYRFVFTGFNQTCGFVCSEKLSFFSIDTYELQYPRILILDTVFTRIFLHVCRLWGFCSETNCSHC